jgi:hypothetical protein
MFFSTNDLVNYSIGAIDGHVGHVKDFYFDDDAWVIRYLVVDTGSWLSSRRVLVSPIAVHDANRAERTLPVSITMAQVKASPDFDSDKPLSRQDEIRYLGSFGYPFYWGGTCMWGDGMYPYAMMPGHIGYGLNEPARELEARAYRKSEDDRTANADPHLRSCKEVVGYQIHAIDGDIGHVDGFLLDEETWAIRYVIVNTSNWWVDHRVLIAPRWITGASWASETLTVDLTRESIKAAPPYNADLPWGPEQDTSLYQHYGRTGYWAGNTALSASL